jgi:cell division protein FtsL
LDRRGLLERSRHRQARLLLSLSIALVAAALAIASVGHAVLARQQLVIDKVQSQVQRTLQTEQNLQLERAQLETPARVLRIAESRYGMVAPQSVSYLKPVNPGESVLKAEQRRAGALQRTAR